MGRELTQRRQGQAKEPKKPRDRRSPLDAALKLLAVRARSQEELDRALGDRDYTPEERAQVISRLGELGYLDDARFGRERALGLLRSGFGPTAVAEKLVQHGLSASAAREALEGAQGEFGFDTLASAEALLARKRLVALDEPKAKARAMRLLVGRGFSEDVARKAVRALDCEGEGG